MKEYIFALIDKSKGEIPAAEHHRSVFPYAFTKGIRWLFGPKRWPSGERA